MAIDGNAVLCWAMLHRGRSLELFALAVVKRDFRRLGVDLRPTFLAYHPVLTELPAPGYFVQRSPAHPLARNCCENEFAG